MVCAFVLVGEKVNTFFVYLHNSFFIYIVNFTQICYIFCSLAAGNWGSWLEWSQCDATCDNGTQIRERVCDDPAPILDGADCIGSDSETRNCTSPCDIGKSALVRPDGKRGNYM